MLKVNYQRILILFISLLILFLLSIILINYYVDGGNQFYQANAFEKNLENSFLMNNKILVCTNYNDRSLKRTILEKMPIRPNILIFGSSRSMPVSQNLFGTARFYNASVSSARLQDDMALYYLYQKRGWKPDALIISLDQWILDDTEFMNMWKTTYLSEYHAMKKLIFRKDTFFSNLKEDISGAFEKYSQLLSIDYLKSSFKKIGFLHRLVYKNLPIDRIIINPTQNDQNTFPFCYLQQADGTRFTAQTDERVTPEQADFVSLKDLQHPWPLQLSAEYLNIFEHFIDYLVGQNVNVIFYLPPYEPKAYAEFQKNPAYHIENEAEKYFLAVAKKYHIQVIGSYDPNKLNLTAKDFFDYTHLKQKGIQKVFLSDKNA